MSPQPQFELANMLNALYCVNDPLIISRKSMHKHNFGQCWNYKVLWLPFVCLFVCLFV